jgi:hypothetical protein
MGALRQGEILSDVIQVHVQIESLNPVVEEITLAEKSHPQAIILTQDCDLDWDFSARNQPDGTTRLQLKLVPNVLLCELIPEDALRGRMKEAGIRGSDLWRRVEQNQDERYHWFASVAREHDRLGAGLPSLVADFKRVFTVPTDELYLRLQHGVRRRSVLQSQFLQHFSNRFGYYCLRVALPETAASVEPAVQVGGST